MDQFDKLYSEVVKQSTCGIFQEYGHTDGIIQLSTPIAVIKEYYRPFESENPLEELHVAGVDCNTGELITREDRHLRYNQLTLEELVLLHHLIMSKQYSFNLNYELI